MSPPVLRFAFRLQSFGVSERLIAGRQIARAGADAEGGDHVPSRGVGALLPSGLDRRIRRPSRAG